MGAIDTKAQVKSDAVFFRCVDTCHTIGTNYWRMQLHRCNKPVTQHPWQMVAVPGGKSSFSSVGTVTSPAPTPAQLLKATRQAEEPRLTLVLSSKCWCATSTKLWAVIQPSSAWRDVNNPAWTFNSVFWRKFWRLLGNVIYRWRSTHLWTREYHQRQWLLQPFKPDGTYLFSINAKNRLLCRKRKKAIPMHWLLRIKKDFFEREAFLFLYDMAVNGSSEIPCSRITGTTFGRKEAVIFKKFPQDSIVVPGTSSQLAFSNFLEI